MSKSEDVMTDFWEASTRALEAKTDYMGELPGDIYRRQRDDVEAIWGLLESPIEQVAIFQLAGGNYAYEGDPVYAKVASKRGQFSLLHFPVQIIPQVEFGPYRVDFLFDLARGRPLALECDGAEFHQDAERDRVRDEHLRQHHGISVLRVTGKSLWRNNKAIQMVVEVIQARLM